MSDKDQIRWRSWDRAAFEEARASGRPIFLSITASWCHWCHVMDGESFDHPEVIRRLNRDFIPVRVDSDKWPDINGRYNMGGWPTVAILDTEGRVLSGESYLPTGQLLGMLSDLAKPPRVERGTVLPRPARPAEPRAGGPDASLIDTVAGFLERAFDREYGGFGGPPKFPQPGALEFAMHLYRRTGEVKWRTMADLTLEQIRSGEIHDLADGGFFRYATRGDWDGPHFEKLLEINARMISVYLQASVLTGSAPYRAVARGGLDYLFTTLWLEDEGRFCGSQTADAEYYTLPEEERLHAEPPALDRTFYADANAAAVSALLKAHAVLGDRRYREAALRVLDRLRSRMYHPERGLYHFDDGDLSLPGYLADQVHAAAAYLDAFETIGGVGFLDEARDLVNLTDRNLWDGDQGGYFDLPMEEGREGILKVRIKPFVDNTAAAIVLTRLYHLTGEGAFRDRAGRVLEYLSAVFPPYKHLAAPFGLALERFAHPPVQVAVVGKRDDPRWTDLVLAAHRIPRPWKIVLPLDRDEDAERMKRLGYSPSDEPRAHPCVGTMCLPPVTRPEELEKLIRPDQMGSGEVSGG